MTIPCMRRLSEGRQFPGMEHWLPLFYDRLETLFDYLPHALITTTAQIGEAREERAAQIEDFYQARQEQTIYR